MPKTVVKIDLNESPYKNPMIHNRWHPDIPMVAWVKPGDDFIIETYDWTGFYLGMHIGAGWGDKDGGRSAELSGHTSLVTGAQGVSSIAKSKMGAMTEEGKWTLQSYDFDNIQVTTPTPDVAIIVYTVTQKVRMDGRPQTMHAADSSTWVRGANGWECHAHSETLLKDGEKTH